MARQIESAHKNRDARFKLITALKHLKDRSVTRLRETGNMRNCEPLPNLNVSPAQVNHFLSNQPCISPVDYDAPMERVILYPQPSPVQAQLIKIFETWLTDAARVLSTKSKKPYGTRQSSQWKLHGRWSGCNYFARLVLQEVDAFPSVVLETIHIERGKENDEHFERDYIYEKAARWFEGSPNGTMQLVIIAIISHDLLLPWTSPLLRDWNPASPCHDWGMSPHEINNISAATITTNIAAQDKNSTSLTGVDLYLATASYPNHRGYSEHVWHGLFRADGQLLPPDYNSVASDFALSQIFPQVIGSPEYIALNELRIPVNELRTTLPRAIGQDRLAQAEFVARDAQQKAREWRSQASPRYQHEQNGMA